LKGAEIDCLSFVMCPLLAQLIIDFFFLMQLFTVLMKQTRQAVRATKQDIFLDVYGAMTLCIIALCITTFIIKHLKLVVKIFS
jgi:hypothetical protein